MTAWWAVGAAWVAAVASMYSAGSCTRSARQAAEQLHKLTDVTTTAERLLDAAAPAPGAELRIGPLGEPRSWPLA